MSEISSENEEIIDINNKNDKIIIEKEVDKEVDKEEEKKVEKELENNDNVLIKQRRRARKF